MAVDGCGLGPSDAARLHAVPTVNFVTWLVFGWDKQQAVEGGRRVRESDLLLLAAIGGSPGAFLARRMFRHKTRKQPFSDRLVVVAVIQAAVLAGLLASLIRMPA